MWDASTCVLQTTTSRAAVTITAESLSEPTQLGVRIVGRDLLERLREKAEHLLSSTLRPKAQRRLKRIADATRASRDFEVHIEWLDWFGASRNGKYRKATEWLMSEIAGLLAKELRTKRRALSKANGDGAGHDETIAAPLGNGTHSPQVLIIQAG